VNIFRRSVPECVAELRAAGVSEVLARIYAARGVSSAAELDCGFSGLPAWNDLKGIESAAKRLTDAIVRGERILIVADYDADGATACAVGMRGLTAMGGLVDFLVPNRFEFGYGLTPEIVALAAERRPALIMTVDNGIASVDGVAAAHARSIDVLITDHHLPGDRLPDTAWIVNPNQPGCEFPSKHLAGVGVMFYLLRALRATLRGLGHFANAPEPNLAALLDLVALGTVADVVRLDRVNRILVEQGLRRIRAGRMQPGVAALFAAGARDPRYATTYDLGFVAGPRINAAGRLADMSIGIACLVTDDPATAQRLALQLDRLNRERRDIEATMQDEALAALDAPLDVGASTLCLYRREWHQGVIGVVASRLKDRYHRPTIVFAQAGNGELRGSGRSITGFHLRDALDLVAKRAPGIISRFGGHAYAAGLSLPETELARFTAEFDRVGREWLTAAQLEQRIDTDGALSPGEITLGLAEEFETSIWGQGFPRPIFDNEFRVATQRVVADKHLKLALTLGDKDFEAILFNQTGTLPRRIRAAYRPDVHRFQGRVSLQLVIEYWEPI
jgi:single-stranded-DNA-specific exonuclease